MKIKAFFIIFNGLSLKQIKQFFWGSESPTLENIRYEITILKVVLCVSVFFVLFCSGFSFCFVLFFSGKGGVYILLRENSVYILFIS